MLKVEGYIKENWGSPFIVGFMLLLLTAAVSLSIGFSFFTNSIATYAFYALIAGVVLQLVCFSQNTKKGMGKRLNCLG